MCRRWSGLSVICVFCVLLLTASAGAGSKPKTLADGRISGTQSDVNDANGPTVLLSYHSNTPQNNPTSSFMYFVPLISPTLVDMEISTNNTQLARIVSYKKKVTATSFYVSCEFEMLGEGFFKTIFDAPEIIEIFLPEQDKDEPMTNILDYIKFEGEGLGCIEAWGKITDSNQTVTRVDVRFDAQGHKSPVTIGLYSVEPENGRYKYENKYNETIARVASLTFRKSEREPRMEVTVVSVSSAAKPNGFLGRVRGIIANFFIEPPRISKLGNETMLDFGYALLKQKPSFTFPKADNIREIRVVKIKK